MVFLIKNTQQSTRSKSLSVQSKQTLAVSVTVNSVFRDVNCTVGLKAMIENPQGHTFPVQQYTLRHMGDWTGFTFIPV